MASLIRATRKVATSSRREFSSLLTTVEEFPGYVGASIWIGWIGLDWIDGKMENKQFVLCCGGHGIATELDLLQASRNVR